MKLLIVCVFYIIINLVYSASSFQDYLDLDSASVRFADTRSLHEPSKKLWKKFQRFLTDPDFLERNVLSSLEHKMPEISQIIPWMDCQQLLKTACKLRRLHFLTEVLKEAYENIFYMLEFSIETLNPEDINKLWKCIAECGYRLPRGFFERLDNYTVKRREDFNPSLILSTLRYLSVLPEGQAFDCFSRLFSKIENLSSACDFNNFLFLRAYLAEVKGRSVCIEASMQTAIEHYQESAIHHVMTSSLQCEVAHFLQNFNPEFVCEAFYLELDIYLDIAHMQSRKVVDMDGVHHYKEHVSSSRCIRRPADLMRDALLLSRGWKVYRIKPDEWNAFKESFVGKMTEKNTIETFYKIYAVNL